MLLETHAARETVKNGDERVNGTLRKRGGLIHLCWVSHTHRETHCKHDFPMAAASDALIAPFLSGQGTLLQHRADETARKELRR